MTSASLVLVLALGAGDAAQMQKLTERLSSFSVLHGNFIQVKRVQGLEKPLTSKGEFILDKKLGMLWHTQKPFDTKLRVNAHGVAQLKGNKAVPLLDEKQRAGFEPWSKLFFGMFAGDLSALNGPFEVQTLDGADGKGSAPFHVVLVPKDPVLKKGLASITLEGTDKVEHITLAEPQGDSTDIRFSEMKTNAPLSDAEHAELAE